MEYYLFITILLCSVADPNEEALDPDEEVFDEDTAEMFEALQRASSPSKSEALVQKSYDQGIFHLAASIASKFRNDKSLGTTEMKSDLPSTTFAAGVNKGGFLTPTKE